MTLTSDVLRDREIADEVLMQETITALSGAGGFTYQSEAEMRARLNTIFEDLRGGQSLGAANAPAPDPGDPSFGQPVPAPISERLREAVSAPVQAVRNALAGFAGGLGTAATYVLIGLGLVAVIAVSRTLRG